MLKYFHEKQKAVQITVRLEGDVQEYAMSFLHIFNNVREYSPLYKVENVRYSNDVIVTCNPDKVEDAKEYLEQFGEIRRIEEINWFVIRAEYDRTGWGELWGDDCEIDFEVDVY